MSEALSLRILANAIDKLELLEGFKYPVAGSSDVRVEWTLARSCVGYKEMSEAVSSIVSARFDEFRALAIEAAKLEVEQCRADLAHSPSSAS